MAEPETHALRGSLIRVPRRALYYRPLSSEAVYVEVHLHPSGDQRVVELPRQARGIDLLNALDLAIDVHLLARDGAPVPEDEELRDGDRIRVIAVVSGG